MTLTQFERAVEKLQAHFKEREDLEAALKVLSPTGTNNLEFGSWFIDSYIWAVGVALEDDYNWFSWFVFENDFGAKGLSIYIDGVETVITNAIIFYETVYNGK
jgi:hypothetical protein